MKLLLERGLILNFTVPVHDYEQINAIFVIFGTIWLTRKF